MNFKTLLATCLVALCVTSCIKEEALNREADILSVTIEDDGFLVDLPNAHTNEISLVVDVDKAEFKARYQSGKIIPTIEVSPKATISPTSGETVELSDYKYIYTVTSEEGRTKDYVVEVIPYNPLIQGFEDWLIVNPNSKRPYEIPKDPMWVNANQGVNILYKGDFFPTRSIDQWRPGSGGRKSVLLETVRGNRNSEVGVMDIPVYAGSMYRGKFAIKDALKDPLSTTLFGQPHPKDLGKPLVLVAYYKYKSGSPYLSYEGGVKDIKDVKEDSKRKDEPDIYAILYKVPKNAGKNVYLTANDIKTSDKIVATAILEDTSEKENWEYLTLKFDYKEEVNFDLHDYKLAVVLSSSTDGAMYQGAVGSQLIVDDLRIVCEEDEDKDDFLK